MTKIRTAVIPVGGFGTRFLPASKTIPKEMFPVGNKPVILHVVEEVIAAGITNIVFIVNHHKQALESFFSRDEMMEQFYVGMGKQEKVDEMKRISSLADFTFVYSEPPLGNGGALNAVKHVVGTDPFVLVWGDEFFLNRGKKNRIQECCDVFEKYDIPTVAAFHMPKSRLSRYGIASISTKSLESGVMKVKKIIEKPKKGKAPSDLAVLGTYVLTYDIFQAIAKVKADTGGELWLTDLINVMAEKTGLLARVIAKSSYLDCGNPHDYLLSQVEYALSEKNLDPHFTKHLARLLRSRTR